jgi:hypothetical protein
MLHVSAFQHERCNLLFRIGVVLFLCNKPFPEERSEVQLHYKYGMCRDAACPLFCVGLHRDVEVRNFTFLSGC